MIGRIRGHLKARTKSAVLIEISGISYEVMLPGIVMKAFDRGGDGAEVEFVTYHYYQTDPSKSVPVLIGFFNEIEREFFEQFITVSGIGPKAACRALSIPFSMIADAIDRADIAILKQMPGIGERRAREIIAKLQGRVGKYGLMQDHATVERTSTVAEDVLNEAREVLIQLQYKRREADEMLQKALERDPSVRTAEDLLNEVYKQKKAHV